MSQLRKCAAMAAGSAAALFIGAPAFTAGPAAQGESLAPVRGLGKAAAMASTHQDGPRGGHAAAAAASVAGALALGALAGRSSCSKVACKAVLTKDDGGRFRFDVPAKPLVPQEQPGVTAPLGFFDPLGFSKGGLMTFPGDPTGWKHLREAEIKHGRVAMMGSIGSVAAHYWKFPGFEKVPTGIAALDSDLGGKGFAALFLLVGLFEASNWKQNKGEPGSYGDPFKFGQFTMEMRTRELNNGRMAMFAMIGQLAAELVTGLDPVEQFGV